MAEQQLRIPQSCPPGFLGRYTVLPGDTFYIISQIFRVRLEALTANNPHITDPNVIYPGDVICVPGSITFPCSTLLQPQRRVPFGTGGVAFLNFGPGGGQSVSFLATLPQPRVFGNFDNYIGEIIIPSVDRFRNQLFATTEDPATWSVRIDLPTAASIMPNSRVSIRPFNLSSRTIGPVVLEGIITAGSCCTDIIAT